MVTQIQVPHFLRDNRVIFVYMSHIKYWKQPCIPTNTQVCRFVWNLPYELIHRTSLYISLKLMQLQPDWSTGGLDHNCSPVATDDQSSPVASLLKSPRLDFGTLCPADIDCIKNSNILLNLHVLWTSFFVLKIGGHKHFHCFHHSHPADIISIVNAGTVAPIPHALGTIHWLFWPSRGLHNLLYLYGKGSYCLYCLWPALLPIDHPSILVRH